MPVATMQTNDTAPVFNVIAGDSDLLPPRFGKDHSLDADDCVKDFPAYIKLRKIPAEVAVLVFRTRMTETAHTWIVTIPEELSLEEHIASFRERFSASGNSYRPVLMSEFWERRQRADEKTADYIEHKARFAQRLRIPDERFIVEVATQGMRADIRCSVLFQNPTTIKALRVASKSPTPALDAPAATHRT